MRRVTLQLVVATVVVVAFVATVLSGIVLWAPVQLGSTFGIGLLEWRTIHKWGAAALTAAVLVHVVLHRRRVVEMIARLARPAPPRPAAVTPASDPTTGASDRTPALDAASVEGEAPQTGRRLRLSRRRFLIVSAGVAAAVVAALGLDRAGSLTRSGKSSSGPAGLLAGFPVLNVESGPPPTSAADWVVVVDGQVERPQRFDRTAWLALPRTQETRTFNCVEGWSVDHVGWEGVRVADVLRPAVPLAGGAFVTFHAYGATYSDSLPLAQAQAPETLLADTVDGEPLPGDHGGPLRLVVPSQLGYKNVKWVVRLEVTASQEQGYWEARGYPADAPVS